MGFDEVTFFGTIVKTHGIKGHLVLRCYDNFKCKKNNPVFLFFREGDLLKQAAVSEIQFTYPFCRIKFADIADINEAETWLKKEVYIEKKALLQNEIPYKFELIGCSVTDSISGLIGNVIDIAEYPQQQIAIINANGKEVLIPLNINFITRFNSTENNLVVTLPDGLLDIYLQ